MRYHCSLVRFAGMGLLVLALVGCGGGESGPTDPGTPSEVLPPNPDGMLLEAPPEMDARAAAANLPPSPAEPDEAVNGILATRLVGVLAPGISAGEVNAALEAAGARIVSMRQGSPFVTLKIPRVADTSDAAATADALRSTGAFVYVRPATVIRNEDVSVQERSSAGSLILPPGGTGAIAHLEAMGFPAAWNAASLALSNNDRIDVLVPDEYASLLPHDEIDAQSIAGFGGPSGLPGDIVYPGNHGFVVSGVIGANFDETPVTGTSPDPNELLDIVSLPVGGLTWFDIFWNIGQRLGTSGDRFVVNTSIGYNDPDFVTWSRLDRALHVLAWRTTAALHYPRYIHVTSAGGAENPELNSPFIAAAAFDDVHDMVDLETLTAADLLTLDTAWDDMLESFPLATALAPNVVVVASADAAGTPSSFSAPGDVWSVGEDVAGPCLNADPGAAPGFLCDGNIAVYSGTGVAAASVTGLAAYLMNLSDISPAEVRTLLLGDQADSETGLLDAYRAVLSLDGGTPGTVLEAIFDVAGTEPEPGENGKFDHNDIRVMLDEFSSAAPAQEGPLTHPRYDLNGDGVAGGEGVRTFDLDGDGSYTPVSQGIQNAPVQFDEQAVRDVDVLCYYAYSALYSGDPDERDLLLGTVHGGPFLEVQFPDVIEPGAPTPITIRAGINTQGNLNYIEGVDIDVYASDGTVEVEDGLTNAGGSFTTTIALDTDDNDTRVEVDARFPTGERVEWQKVSRRPNKIEFLDRDSEVNAWVSASYTPDPEANLQIVYDHGEEDGLEGEPGTFNVTLTEEDTGEAAGMGMSSTVTAKHNSDVYTQNGNEFSGAFFSGSVEGTSTLNGPDPELHNYQSWASGDADFEVDFVVWGEPAAFMLTASINSTLYEISLHGPSASIRCYPGDSDDPDEPGRNRLPADALDHCPSLNESGLLEPGEYTLRARVRLYGTVQQNCGDPWDPQCSTFGDQDFDGSIQLNLNVSH